jgi:DNA-binding transcriptional LysR family regulator
VEVELGQMAPRLQLAAIAEGRLDVGYAPALGLVLDPPLIAQQAGSWPWVVALAADHPLARKQRLSPSALADQPFILYATHALDEGQADVLRHLLGGEPRVAQRAPDTLSVLALVGAGLGITLVPAPLAKLAVPHVVYRTIAGSGPTSDLVLVSRGGETAGAVRRFVALAMTGRDSQA